MRVCSRCGTRSDDVMHCRLRLFCFDNSVSHGDFEVDLCETCRTSVLHHAWDDATAGKLDNVIKEDTKVEEVR